MRTFVQRARQMRSTNPSKRPRFSINAAVPGALQSKLAISELGDSFEQDADRVANQIVSSRASLFPSPCACGGACPGCQAQQTAREEELSHGKDARIAETATAVAPSMVEKTLGSSGEALDATTKEFFESRFGHDFSQVRVHRDDRATEAAAGLQANAFTVGHDMVFGAGQYHPGTSKGKRLIAHELAHVLQQQPNALAVQRQSNSATPQTREWTPNDFVIVIHSAEDLGVECTQHVEGSGRVLRKGCGPVRPPFCQSAGRDYRVEFSVDWGGDASPYPPGRPMPTVSAQFKFITTSGHETIHISETDRSPTYAGQGDSLRGRLDRNFSISTAESGTLFVTAQLKDPVTRRTFTNSLSIDYIIEPCA